MKQIHTPQELLSQSNSRRCSKRLAFNPTCKFLVWVFLVGCMVLPNPEVRIRDASCRGGFFLSDLVLVDRELSKVDRAIRDCLLTTFYSSFSGRPMRDCRTSLSSSNRFRSPWRPAQPYRSSRARDPSSAHDASTHYDQFSNSPEHEALPLHTSRSRTKAKSDGRRGPRRSRPESFLTFGTSSRSAATSKMSQGTSLYTVR